MQTKEDIEKWKKYLKVIESMAKQGGNCGGFKCMDCPFHYYNNGYKEDGQGCIELGINVFNTVLHSSVCDKYLAGDITFVDGKLVEVED